MGLEKLSSGALTCIESLHLSSERAQIVKRCVSGYTTPRTFCGGLSWIIYRIQNAIRGIFGCSDWDLAKSAIYDHFYERAASIGLINEKNDNLRAHGIQNKVLEIIELGAKKLFYNCLDAQEGRIDSSPEFVVKCDRAYHSLYHGLQDLKDKLASQGLCL